MDNEKPVEDVVTLKISSTSLSEPLSVRVGWSDNATLQDITGLLIIAIHEDITDIISNAVEAFGKANNEPAKAKSIIDQLRRVQKLFEIQHSNNAGKTLVIDPEDVFKMPQRPTP